MLRISLKRLLAKKELTSLINEMSASLETLFCIYDVDGNKLMGNDHGELPCKYPIKTENKLIGCLYGEEKTAVLARLLNHLANIEMEKKVLGQETLAKYKEITLFYEIAEKLASNLNPQEVAQLAIDEALALIKGDKFAVFLYNDETHTIETLGIFSNKSFLETVSELERKIVENVILNEKAEILNNIKVDGKFSKDSTSVSSLICTPLKIKNHTIGAIQISSEKEANYSAEDLKILSALSFQAAATIENARLYDNLKETFLTSIYTLAETIEKRDHYTGGHTKRVMAYSVAIAEVLELPEQEMENVRLAAILHDIGKIGVSDSILLKPGQLSPEEFESIKMHPIYGEEILKHVKQLQEVIPGVKYHHERFDGKGYPENLAGEKINLVARIIAVADSFDAMTSTRSYRNALSLHEALEILHSNAGSQFDPAVVDAFFQACEQGKIELGRLKADG